MIGHRHGLFNKQVIHKKISLKFEKDRIFYYFEAVFHSSFQAIFNLGLDHLAFHFWFCPLILILKFVEDRISGY